MNVTTPRRGEDPEVAAAARRRQESHLRDIGDEAGLYRLGQPRTRKPRAWLMVVAIAFVVVAGYLAFRGGKVAIDRNCEAAALQVGSQEVATAAELPWSATGPNGGSYAVEFGDQSDRRTFNMADCLADGRINAPDRVGTYVLRLLHRVDDRFVQVDRIKITVVEQSG